LCRVPQAVATLLISLEYDERHETARHYALSAFEISKLAAWIAERSADTEMFKLAALTAVPLARSGGEECITWAKETIERIRDNDSRNDGLERLDRQIRRCKGETVEGDIWGDATAEQIYTNMAMAIGIDMSNAADPIAQLVRIGIADDDPTRVFETCQHVFVSIGPLSPVERYLSQRLGAAVGPKLIECTKHNYALMDTTLDGAYDQFDKKHCSICPDRGPRPPGWKYSREWHNEEGVRIIAAKSTQSKRE
jgi:hypothetical protein